jgi:hypothetical protein
VGRERKKEKKKEERKAGVRGTGHDAIEQAPLIQTNQATGGNQAEHPDKLTE